MSQRTILVVEDNPDDEMLTLRALGEAGVALDIAVARDGAEALEYLFGSGRYASRASAPPPSVVLLDLKLPKLDGFDVLHQVRANERTRSLCVVIFTSSREQQDIEACYRLGCNSFVSKPVAYEQYIETVRDLGRYWTRLNESPATART